ncbi:MAG TPA: metallophosphoesterase [Mycobacteriales bacterium]|nr:metallophosphoesterase [Mycobacteriales bacterium]
MRTRVLLLALVIGAIVTPFALLAPASEPRPSETLRLTANADTWLDGSGDQPADTGAVLRVDGIPRHVALLRFPLAVTSRVQRATLRLWAVSKSFGETEVRRVSGPWTEKTLPSAAPSVGEVVGRIPPHGASGWLTVELGEVVPTPGGLDLVITSTRSEGETYASREDDQHAPQLLLTGPRLDVLAVRAPVSLPPLDPSRIRAAFYYPWFPESWKQQGHSPFSQFRPSAGYYDSGDPATIARTFDDLRYAGMDAVISSWWGPASPTAERLPLLLATAATKGIRVAAYYEREGTGDPEPSQLRSDLQALVPQALSPAYLRVDGRSVLFVYAGPTDGCDMARRWQVAQDLGFYVVLKVFEGFRTCDVQPQAWHQYAPANRWNEVGSDSVSVSPGFWKKGEKRPRLARDPIAFADDVARMAASSARFQLVTTYNEWGEGTSVESAREWGSGGGRGVYLDVLHRLLGDPVVAAAGDISCDTSDKNYRGGRGTGRNCMMAATSDLLVKLAPAAVLPLGDVQYQCGEKAQFEASYAKSWGRLKSRTRPAIGNHEYGRECGRNDPSDYFDYFGPSAGRRYEGWYSYDIGSWHLIALNSECRYGGRTRGPGGCATGSAQETWLRKDLATSKALCTLAYWHEPRWSSGQHGDAQQMTDIWNDLVGARVELVLSGHNHDYERFGRLGRSPADPEASSSSTTTGKPSYQQPTPDPLGTRQFVVGTGGRNHYGFSVPQLTGQEVRDSSSYGVLALTLGVGRYSWEFLPVAGGSFTDSGSDVCH